MQTLNILLHEVKSYHLAAHILTTPNSIINIFLGGLFLWR